jgi:zinc D-Ala-D-Ala carboxypeptidase
VTPHFDIAEFVHSDTADARGITNKLPPELMSVALETLQMMERIRDELCRAAGRDVPITITSGYRCAALNEAIGSIGKSDHVRAMAVDWRAPSFGTPAAICAHLVPLVVDLEIGQLINEYPDRAGWVHTSTAMPLRAVNRVITITAAGVSVGITEA